MKNKKIIIVGNWKMNPNSETEAIFLVKKISKSILKFKKISVIICPPFVYLKSLSKYFFDKNRYFLGVQNISGKIQGSYTGEISVDMVSVFNARYSIVGHSEIRNKGETDEMIAEKISLAISKNIIPILCIGEKTRDESGAYLNDLRNQILKSLFKVKINNANKIIIAYEPVWAIGAKSAMDTRNIHETTLFVRKILSELYGVEIGLKIPVLYGGSVSIENARNIIVEGETNGLLIGRDSLNDERFIKILNDCDAIK